MKRALVLTVALVAASLLGPARAATPASCGAGTPTLSLTGSFDAALQGSYVFVPFEVPVGMTSVRVRLCHDQPDAPTSSQIKDTLDLGVYQARAGTLWDEEEFRGWGGSSRRDVLITPEQATLGFDPGPIPAGEWAAEIGLAAIPGPADGDADSSVAWRVEVFLGADPADADAPYVPAAYDTTPARAEPAWYKGDFHVHAEHSNPNDATMRAVFNYAFAASGADLDFITLSDYVGRRQWDEIGRFQADYPGKLVIRSAEIITYRGHTNNHGSHTFVDYRTGPLYALRGGALSKLRDARAPSGIFSAVHAAGGWTQVNHPTIFPSKVPAFANLCRGCSWEYTDAETDWRAVDAFEVQTGPAGTPGQTGNELGPNPFTPAAIEWWDRLTREGFRITAVGASDSHRADRADITYSPIGEATTVVYADELSEDAIGEAIRKGHAYVKFFSAKGPDLRFSAHDGATIMGDTVRGPTALTATVLNVSGAQPRTLHVFRDGVPILAFPVTSPAQTFTFDAAVPGAYRLQLQRGSAIEALTNPITATPGY